MKTCQLIPFMPYYLFTSCSDITMLGHVSAYDVNAELKAAPLTPASMNAGFESHSFVAVPHAHSLKTRQYASSKYLPVGDVLPTITRLRIEGVLSGESLNGVAFDFVSSGATGEAAIVAAGGTPKSLIPLIDQQKAEKIGAKIEEITTNAAVIPIR